MNKKVNRERLELWQDRLSRNAAAFSAEEMRMDAREALYRGDDRIQPLTALDTQKDGTLRRARHVRNIVAENIESQVSSAIPQPKVTARRKQDENKAKLIEDMLRNELNRLPFETMNDMMERTVPIQGGGLFLVEWDNTRCTHTSVGEISVKAVHPKQVIPQNGVYTGIEDMDYLILKLPQTKEYLKRRYGVDLDAESESEPEIRGADGEGSADELVTQYTAYYRNADGGIGLYSWVNDTQLEDLEDYQARRLRRCAQCRTPEPVSGGEASEGVHWSPGDPCPNCGSTKWQDSVEEYEELCTDIATSAGKVIPAMSPATDSPGSRMKPTKIPYYKPNVFPVVLQKNISVFGQLLGDSDVDKVACQQNTVNRMEMKIIDRLIKAGTRVTLPDRADFRIDPEDGEKWYIGSAADKAAIGVFDFGGNLQYEMVYLNQVYEEARQILGVTDSFQGRRDTTATSGVAKQFSAAQAAGRLESKRVLKEAAYADLFQLMFRFKLAYADEPRPVVSADDRGNAKYEEFNRYDFLETDDAGQYYWNDQFLFSCDAAAPLASNREAMWSDLTAHLNAGAFGNPTDIETLILYWSKMELLHYPGAADTRAYLEEKKKRESQSQPVQPKFPMHTGAAASEPAGNGMQADTSAKLADLLGKTAPAGMNLPAGLNLPAGGNFAGAL